MCHVVGLEKGCDICYITYGSAMYFHGSAKRFMSSCAYIMVSRLSEVYEIINADEKAIAKKHEKMTLIPCPLWPCTPFL